MRHSKYVAWSAMLLPVALVCAGLVYASSVTTPNTFVGGTAVVAAEVNANFSAHAAAINDNDARLSTLESTAITQFRRQLHSFDTESAVFTNSLGVARRANLMRVTKHHDDTKFELVYDGEFSLTENSSATFSLAFGLDDFNPGSFPAQIERIYDGALFGEGNFRTIYDGLPAGEYTVTVWGRAHGGTATGLTLSPRNSSETFFIKEYR